MAVNAYVSETRGDSAIKQFNLTVENYHRCAITVIGYSSSYDQNIFLPLKEELELEGYRNKADRKIRKIWIDPGTIYFKLKGQDDSIYTAEIMPWSAPKLSHPRLKLAKKFDPQNGLFQIKGNRLTILAGNYEVDQLIYVPAKYRVTVEEGVVINFRGNSGLIINNNFIVNGSEQKPVKFNFESKKSHGLTILDSDNCQIDYLEIYGAGSLDYKGWELDAALTIYGSNVKVNHLLVDEVRSPKALHFIRCDVVANHLRIRAAKKDGLVLDYSKVELKETRVSGVGEYAFKLKGSYLDCESCQIMTAGFLMLADQNSRIVCTKLQVGDARGYQFLGGSTYSTDTGFYPPNSK